MRSQDLNIPPKSAVEAELTPMFNHQETFGMDTNEFDFNPTMPKNTKHPKVPNIDLAQVMPSLDTSKVKSKLYDPSKIKKPANTTRPQMRTVRSTVGVMPSLRKSIQMKASATEK